MEDEELCRHVLDLEEPWRVDRAQLNMHKVMVGVLGVHKEGISWLEACNILGRAVKAALMSYCRQCRSSLSTCPNGADIPALIRIRMYSACYENYNQAREAVRGISNGRGLSGCAFCEDCSARCARRAPRQSG